jgi:hypothetical protein
MAACGGAAVDDGNTANVLQAASGQRVRARCW